MPRYFFNVIDGRSIPDAEGTELAGIAEARAQALETAGAILRDEARAGWTGTEWQMHVTDENKRIVLRLQFSAEDIAPE